MSMRNAPTIRSSLLASLLLLTASTDDAASAQQDPEAYEIMKRSDERPIPVDMKAIMTMNLVNRRGSVRARKLNTYRMGDDKQIMWFLEPADVKGSSFLRLSYDDRDDDMWIYLPAFGRVRRIASHARNGSFMGSDLTFEDMGDRKLDDYAYRLVGEEEIDGRPCWVVEAVPNEGVATEYSKRVVTIWQEENAPLTADLYDRRGTLRKQMSFTYQEVGGYLVPARVLMKNLRSGGHTELIFEQIEVDTGISPDLFKSTQLTRLRGG